MNIPSKLRIGGLDWTVEFNKERTDDDNAHGITHLRTQKIYLSPEDTVQKQEQTLIHEMMHALWWQAGLTEREGIKKAEEELITSLSFGVYQVLRDNGFLA